MGFSPLQASAALLPMALVVIPLSRVAPRSPRVSACASPGRPGSG
jgi:hypothetical protein